MRRNFLTALLGMAALPAVAAPKKGNAMDSFKAYPSAVHGYYRGTRDAAFYADTVLWDTAGIYNTGICGITAPVDSIWHFYFNMLFNSVPGNTYLTPLFFVMKAGTTTWIEHAGVDIVCGTWPGGVCPQGAMLVADLKLSAGDSVQARPSYNSAIAPTLALCQSLSGDGVVTCNYWGGHRIS